MPPGPWLHRFKDDEAGVAAVKAAGMSQKDIEENARELAVRDTLTPRAWGDGHHVHAMLHAFPQVKSVTVYVFLFFFVLFFFFPFLSRVQIPTQIWIPAAKRQIKKLFVYRRPNDVKGVVEHDAPGSIHLLYHECGNSFGVKKLSDYNHYHYLSVVQTSGKLTARETVDGNILYEFSIIGDGECLYSSFVQALRDIVPVPVQSPVKTLKNKFVK